eukprot:TRINITY_DN38924_c0_g1_i2.p1 TRINITY_DN38924_c0_g1~~TRINITY_DN38924_c0_g1_i2.p1  ORF type:complete len:258 (-),score=28.36 TRINITY_DN38924_c0_g1_i2:840-1577(-)
MARTSWPPDPDDYGRRLGEALSRCCKLSLSRKDGDNCEWRVVPESASFVCPISTDTFRNPVVTDDGSVYERKEISKWFRECRRRGLPLTSPATGLELASPTLMPLVVAQRLVETFLTARHVAVPKVESKAKKVKNATETPRPPADNLWPRKPSRRYLPTMLGMLGAFATGFAVVRAWRYRQSKLRMSEFASGFHLDCLDHVFYDSCETLHDLLDYFEVRLHSFSLGHYFCNCWYDWFSTFMDVTY